jgi:lysophospholipase L1-like esterase
MRRWLARAGLVLGGLLLGALLAELGARKLQPQGATDLLFNAPENSPTGLYSGHKELLSVPTPGFHATQRSLGYEVELRIDEHGLRGATGAKQGTRWLAVGDSFTFSAQVPEEATFQALLGRQKGIEVLNGGVDGYGTWQSRRRYELLERELDLDGVLLLYFTGNDLVDDEQWPMRQQIARNMPEGEPLQKLQTGGLAGWLKKRSYLYGRLEVWRAARALASGSSHNRMMWEQELALFHSSGAERLDQLARGSRRQLRDLASLARQRRDKLMVAVAPPAFAVDTEKLAPTFGLVGLDPAGADRLAPEEAIVEVLRAEQIATCNLGPALREAQASGVETYLDYDGHWTEDGHRVVAEALAACEGW